MLNFLFYIPHFYDNIYIKSIALEVYENVILFVKNCMKMYKEKFYMCLNLLMYVVIYGELGRQNHTSPSATTLLFAKL